MECLTSVSPWIIGIASYIAIVFVLVRFAGINNMKSSDGESA